MTIEILFLYVLELRSHWISGVYLVIRLSGLFSGIRIITKIELIWRVAQHTLENKSILVKFHTFTTSLFKIKGTLTQMKSNHHWTSVFFTPNRWTVNTEIHPALPVYISPMILSQNKIGLLNTKKIRAILQPHKLEFEPVVFPKIDFCFSLLWSSIQHFWDNLFRL